MPEALVASALQHLRVTEDLQVHYAPDESARPVVVHLWAAPERVREEVEEAHEVRDAPSEASPYLEECRAVVAIELGFSDGEKKRSSSNPRRSAKVEACQAVRDSPCASRIAR